MCDSYNVSLKLGDGYTYDRMHRGGLYESVCYS